jgi:hypothetical protein
MAEPSPARLYATAIGGALVVGGVIGFFYSASFGSPGEVGEVFGLLAVNGWVNLFHVLVGAIGLFVAGSAARRYALWLGAALLGLALWGFLVGSGGAILGFFPTNIADDLLRAALGALGLLAANASPAGRERRGASVAV